MDKEGFRKINMTLLSKGLKSVRLANNHTIEDAAFVMKKDKAYISRVENGKLKPNFDTLSDMLCCYDLTIEDFYLNLQDYLG